MSQKSIKPTTENSTQEANLAVVPKSENSLVQMHGLQNLQSEFQGSVNVRTEIIKIPRLKINNPLSEAVQGGLAKPGDFTVNVRNENFGDSVTIFPLYTDESASYLDKAGTVICSSLDLINSQAGSKCTACPYNNYWNDWGTKENRKVPECKLSINMIALIVEKDKPIDVSNIAELNLRKNNYKAGKELINLIVHDPLRLPFGSKYTLYSRQDKKDKWVYHVVDPNKIEVARITEEELQSVLPAARKILDLKKQNQLSRDFEPDIDDHDHAEKQIIEATPY